MSKTRYAVVRAQGGDPEAVRFLYVATRTTSMGRVGDPPDDHEAEDITQQVFAELMTTLVRYDERGVPFFAWLLRMARNAAIDHLRGEIDHSEETVLDPDAISGADRSGGEGFERLLRCSPTSSAKS